MLSVQKVRSCHGHAIHPTEKPAGILQPLLEYSLPPDGTLLVPFAGSGPDLLLAKQMNRRAVGIEVNEKYAEACANRLRQEVLQFTD